MNQSALTTINSWAEAPRLLDYHVAAARLRYGPGQRLSSQDNLELPSPGNFLLYRIAIHGTDFDRILSRNQRQFIDGTNKLSRIRRIARYRFRHRGAGAYRQRKSTSVKDSQADRRLPDGRRIAAVVAYGEFCRIAGGEAWDLLVVSIQQTDVLQPRNQRRDLTRLERDESAVSAIVTDHGIEITIDDVGRAPFLANAAVLQPDRARASGRDRRQFVTHENHRPTLPRGFLNRLKALSPECRVAHGKHFVNHHDFLLEMGCDGKCQPYLHAVRVSL